MLLSPWLTSYQHVLVTWVGYSSRTQTQGPGNAGSSPTDARDGCLLHQVTAGVYSRAEHAGALTWFSLAHPYSELDLISFHGQYLKQFISESL